MACAYSGCIPHCRAQDLKSIRIWEHVPRPPEPAAEAAEPATGAEGEAAPAVADAATNGAEAPPSAG